MHAKHILEGVARLKQEMRDLRVENARLDESRRAREITKLGSHAWSKSRCELAALLDQFKRTGTD
jgi:hypothetical protein